MSLCAPPPPCHTHSSRSGRHKSHHGNGWSGSLPPFFYQALSISSQKTPLLHSKCPPLSKGLSVGGASLKRERASVNHRTRCCVFLHVVFFSLSICHFTVTQVAFSKENLAGKLSAAGCETERWGCNGIWMNMEELEWWMNFCSNEAARILRFWECTRKYEKHKKKKKKHTQLYSWSIWNTCSRIRNSELRHAGHAHFLHTLDFHLPYIFWTLEF